MRISSTFLPAWVAPVLLALTWGVAAGQCQNLSGTWQMNLEKSRWNEDVKPISVLLVIDHREPEIQYHGAVLYLSEDMRVFGFAGALDGKPYRMSRSFGDGTITLRRLDELTFESSFRTDDGLYTETARTSISRDGKTLTRQLTVRGPDGSQSRVEVYERR